MDLYQQYIHVSRYSRWRDDLGRRETWEETVQRYIDFFDKRTKHQFSEVLQGKVKNAILDKYVRVLDGATVGVDHEKDRARGFEVTEAGVTVVPKHAVVEA